MTLADARSLAAIRLVEFEAQLLDARRFDDWLALFSDDGWYWMPASFDQASPEDALSLLYEDRRLLALRVRRLANPMIHIEVPPSRTHHHLSGLVARSLCDDAIEVDSTQLVVVFRDSQQRFFSAACRHRLIGAADTLRIAGKTVRLLDCDQPHRGFAAPI